MVAAAVAFVLSTVPTRALGQDTIVGAEQGGTEIAFTVSGGVSLGSYEAGYLYLTTQTLRHTDGRYRLRLVTGASAGSVNAVISAIDSCRPAHYEPQEDLGWGIWVALGFEDLFVRDEVGPTNVFSRQGLKRSVEDVRRIWNEGLAADCDVVVGISATRLRSYPVALNEALSLPRQEEKFVLRIRGRGPGVRPTLTNYVDVRSGLPQALLPLRGDGDAQDFDILMNVLFASSAFPLAFAPQQLDYCLSDPEDPTTWECTEPTRHDHFVDGGVFDNNPLRLAADIASYGLVVDEDGRGVWTDLRLNPFDDLRPAYEGSIYQYVDPDVTSYPSSEMMSAEDETSTLGFLAALLGELVTTARAKELYTLAEEQPEILRRLFVTHRNFPTMSGLLGAFLGFFETGFREFDFYLGMYDAYAEAEHRLERSQDESTLEALLSALHPAFQTGDPEQIPPVWKPFACMIGWYEPSAERYRAACEGPEMVDFRILLQVSLDRLYATCAGAEVHTSHPANDNYHCDQAAVGASPPRVVPLTEGDSYVPALEESEFDYVMRLLAQYQFRFKDLGLEPDEAKYASIKIRRDLLKVVGALSEVQPSRAERLALVTGGRFAVNTVVYEPPKHWAYFTLGTGIEVGGSVLPFPTKRSYFRLNLALQIGSLRTLVTPSVAAVSFSLVGGPELEMLWWTSQLVQPMVGVRAGYQFGTADRFSARPCTEGNAHDDPRNCSQAVVQGYVAIALLERLRTQFTFIWFPQDRSFGTQRFDLLAGFGMQFF